MAEGDRTVIRIYFDDGSFKSFIILQKTTALDLIKQVQEKMQTTAAFYLHWGVQGKGDEKLIPENECPWPIWKQYGDKCKFIFRAKGGLTPTTVKEDGGHNTASPRPSPAGVAKPPQPKGVTEDDFDALLDQLSDFDASGVGEISKFDSFGHNLPTCSSCGEIIKENLLAAFGMQWHKEHLACAICKRNFLENDVPVVEGSDGNAYCEPDYIDRFSPKCAACGKSIQGQCTNALGKQWHPNCFVCHTCKQPFTGTFFEHEGNAYCEKHYYDEMGLICPTCERPIMGKCVRARGQRYHPAHFQCSHCKSKLDGKEYFFHNEKIFCKNCSIIFYG